MLYSNSYECLSDFIEGMMSLSLSSVLHYLSKNDGICAQMFLPNLQS